MSSMASKWTLGLVKLPPSKEFFKIPGPNKKGYVELAVQKVRCILFKTEYFIKIHFLSMFIMFFVFILLMFTIVLYVYLSSCK